MNFDKFKKDMVEKVERSYPTNSSDPIERDTKQFFKTQMINNTKMVIDLLEEYDKRKSEEK